MLTTYSYGAMLTLLIHFIPNVSLLDTNITIPLNKTLQKLNKELYGDYFYLNSSSTLQINFDNINENVSFIIFQVHSHLHSVTVYTNREIVSIHGTNIGLYSPIDFKNSRLDTFNVVNTNENIDLKLYISVHGYKATDPTPGGCPLESTIPTIYPWVRPKLSNDYIIIDADPPRSANDPNCLDIKNSYILFYMLYLPEKDFGSDAYFNGIKSMMTFEGIKANGKEVPNYVSFWHMKRLISAYPGTGAIYVAVARQRGAYSVYIPSYTYACSPLEDEDCELIKDEFSKFLCASMIFIGLFTCFMGHRFFKTEMFLVGFSSGFLITYIMISLTVFIDRPALIAASVISGVFYGFGWLTFWWLYGIPVFSVLLPSLNLGFVLASVIHYMLPAGNDILQSDVYFWCFFVLIVLITAMAIVLVTFMGNILCCSVLGACTTIYPIDLYLGSNLKYIFINTLRRALVPGFHNILLMPVFQKTDICVVALWVTLVVSGAIFQYYHNRNRPPFPPPPRSIRPEPPMYGTYDDRSRERVEVNHTSSRDHDETTPLLGQI